MVTRIGTKQRKTRQKYSQTIREKGKIPLSKYFQEFELGESVGLKTHPGVQKGRVFRRFHGFTGKVTGKKGECYEVTIKDGGKIKQLFVHPIHLIKH